MTDISSATVRIGPSRSGAITGYGLAVVGPSDCVILTAAHVLSGAADAHWLKPRLGAGVVSGVATVVGGDDENDFALLKSASAALACSPLPSLETIRSRAVLGLPVEVAVIQPDGSSTLVDGKITGVTLRDLSVTFDERDFLAHMGRGISGAPIFNQGIPLGIIVGSPPGSHLVEVRRLDFIATLLGQGQMPLARSAVAGLATEREAGDLYWTAAGLELMGRPASARRAYESAGQKGMAAAWLSLASLQRDGQGGERDEVRAASLEDRYLPAVFRDAEAGDAAANHALLSRNAEGLLSESERVRARASVASKVESLTRQAKSGDSVASTWLLLYSFTEFGLRTELRDAEWAKRAGLKGKSSNPLLIPQTCVDETCVRQDVMAIGKDLLENMQSGSEMAALIFLVLDRNTIMSFDGPALGPPVNCALLATPVEGRPFRAAAHASCIRVRRIMAVRRLDLLALDDADDFAIWKAALDADVFSLESRNLVALVPYDRADEASDASLAAMQTSWRVEQNLTALLGVALERIDRHEPLAQIVNDLKLFLARAPVRGGSDRAKALGALAVIQCLGGDDQADEKGLQETMAWIQRLDSEDMEEAFLEILDAAHNWDNRETNLEFQAVLDTLGRALAAKGVGIGIARMIEIKEVSPEALRLTAPASLHPYVRAAFENDPTSASALVCEVEGLLKVRDALHRSVTRFCDGWSKLPGSNGFAALMDIYKNDGRRSEREASLSDAAKLGYAFAAELLLSELDPKSEGAAKRRLELLRIQAKDFDLLAMEAIVGLYLNNVVPWNEDEVIYMVALANKIGTDFTCEHDTKGPSCVLTGRKPLANVAGAKAPNLPTIDAARLSTVDFALGLRGGKIYQNYPKATVTPSLATPHEASKTPAPPPPSTFAASSVDVAAYAAKAKAQCWQYVGGEWRKLPGDQTLAACVRTQFSGHCEVGATVTYGRWGESAIRRVRGKAQISTDNRTFRDLVRQDENCGFS